MAIYESRPLRVLAAANDDGSGAPHATLTAFLTTLASRWVLVSDSERSNLAQVMLVAQDLLRSAPAAGIEIGWAGGRPHTMHPDGKTWVPGLLAPDGLIVDARFGAPLVRQHIFLTYSLAT